MIRRALLAALGALAPSLTLVPAPRTQGPVPAPPELCAPFSVRSATAQSLIVPATAGRPFQVRVVLGDAARTLSLLPYDVRTPSFELLADDGNGLHRLPTPPSVTYRGRVDGAPGSAVSAAIVDGQLEATIHLGGTTWGVEPASRGVPGLPRATHVVYRYADVTGGGRCGTPTGVAAPRLLQPSVPTSAGLKECEVAADAHNQFYRQNQSSTTNTQNRITILTNNADVIYQRDVEVQLKLTTIIVRTVPVYTQTQPALLLNEFASVWSTQHRNVQRDVAHMFAGTPVGNTLGIANRPGVCSINTLGFGITWNQGTARATATLAHELGHNFNADHCNGAPSCFIMCASIGGCSGVITRFAQVTKDVIIPYKNTLPCLAAATPTQPPSLIGAIPSVASNHSGASITLTGSNLASAAKVTVASTDITEFTATSTSLTFSLPDPFEIGIHPVTVTNAAGTSNPVGMTVFATHPSVLEAPNLHPRGFPLPYQVFTDRQWGVVLFTSPSNTPSAFAPVVSLGIGAGFTQLFQVASLTADVAGFAELQLMIPASVTPTVLYWQAVTFNPSNLTLPVEVSNVESVPIF